MILYNHKGEIFGGLQQNMMGALSIPMLFPLQVVHSTF